MAAEKALLARVLDWTTPAIDVDWDGVYAEQMPRVYNFFRYRFGDGPVAEDLTSVTFERAWRARHRYRRDLAGLFTWLMAIARNVAVDQVRRSRPTVPLAEAGQVPAGPTPEDLAEQRSDLERLERLLAGLPAEGRELIALKYGAGLTNRAIADLLGLGESNVGTRLHRLVQTLRTRWEELERKDG